MVLVSFQSHNRDSRPLSVAVAEMVRIIEKSFQSHNRDSRPLSGFRDAAPGHLVKVSISQSRF